VCHPASGGGTGRLAPSGSAARTDVTLADAAPASTSGQGANLSDANASAVSPGVPLKDGTTTSVTPCVVADPLILNVAAGNAKSGKVIIYFR
jgi:hypothetical protein